MADESTKIFSPQVRAVYTVQSIMGISRVRARTRRVTAQLQTQFSLFWKKTWFETGRHRFSLCRCYCVTTCESGIVECVAFYHVDVTTILLIYSFFGRKIRGWTKACNKLNSWRFPLPLVEVKGHCCVLKVNARQFKTFPISRCWLFT